MRFILILLCLSASAAGAEEDGGFGTPDPGIHRISLDNQRVREGSRCALLLEVMAKRQGRNLTSAEMVEVLPRLLQLTGETLEPIDREPRHCFGGGARVLTPSGYKPIAQLAIGDNVVSVNELTGTLTANPVADIMVSAHQPTIVFRQMGLEGRMITTTVGHPFFSASAGDYLPAGDLTASCEVLRIRPVDAGRADLQPVRRGLVVPGEGQPVFNLHLRFAPNNFVIEGILVHNIMMKFI